MVNNTKLLILTSFLIIISGFSLLYFGLNPQTESGKPTFSPTPTVESTPIATTSAVFAIEGEKALVTKVIDGDTFSAKVGPASGWETTEVTVRLIGIDTPETKDPRRPVGCFGKQASEETKNLILGKEVILQKDLSETDKYGRLLRYVFLPINNDQTLFVNDYLVREGFAKVLTYPPDVKYNEQFRQAEIEAKEKNKGLWERC